MYVFSVDEDEMVRADFAVNASNYTKSVDNYLGRYVLLVVLLLRRYPLVYVLISIFPGCGKSIANLMRRLDKPVLVCNMRMSTMGAACGISLVGLRFF